MAPRMAALAADPRGHVLAHGADMQQHDFIACVRCGHWAETRPRKLLKPCCGQPRHSRCEGAQALRRIASRRHPCSVRGPLTGPLFTISPELQAHAAQMLDEYISPAKQEPQPSTVAADSASQTTVVVPLTAAQQRLAALRSRVAARVGQHVREA